jgi:hypothetical protein
MKIKTNLSVIFISILCLFSISNADTGFGISDVGTISSILDGIEDENTTPVEYGLNQNYPNPFNPITNIEFSLPKSEFVTVKIFNVLGQEVATLISEKLVQGNHKYIWDASAFASGVYYYKIEVGGFVQSKKLILIK